MWERWLPILLFRASSSSSVKTYVWGDEKTRLLPGLELVLLLAAHPKAGLAAMLPCQAPGSRGTEGQELPHCSPFPIKALQTSQEVYTDPNTARHALLLLHAASSPCTGWALQGLLTALSRISASFATQHHPASTFPARVALFSP